MENFILTVQEEYRDPNGVKRLRDSKLKCNINAAGQIYVVFEILDTTPTEGAA